jgi:hypothetical protein
MNTVLPTKKKVLPLRRKKLEIKEMNLLNFSTIYPDEASCKAKWKDMRDSQGVKCIHCGSTEHYWKSDKECYECKRCKYRQGLRANTIMQKTEKDSIYRYILFRHKNHIIKS